MHKKVRKVLSNASDDKKFVTEFGELTNLRQLRNALVGRGNSFYNAYVNEKENHFANWVENVFEDTELAESLRNAKSYGHTLKILSDKIRYYELWLSYNNSHSKLMNFLVNGPFSIKNKMNQHVYEPLYHSFETLSNFNERNIQPKVPKFRPAFNPGQNLKPVNEEQLLKELERQLLHLQKVQPVNKPRFFEKLFGKK